MTITINKQMNAFIVLILLTILCFTPGIGAAAPDADKTSAGLTPILALDPPKLTDEYLVLSIRATGPIQYRKPVILKRRNGGQMVVYVDMPNTRNSTGKLRLIRMNLVNFLLSRLICRSAGSISRNFDLIRLLAGLCFTQKQQLSRLSSPKGMNFAFSFPFLLVHSGNARKLKSRKMRKRQKQKWKQNLHPPVPSPQFPVPSLQSPVSSPQSPAFHTS